MNRYEKQILLGAVVGLMIVLVAAFAYLPVLASQPEFVTICHAAGQEGTLQYVTLTLPYQAVYGQAGHLNENGTTQAGHENDYLGPCEEVEEPTPTPVPTDEPSETPTDEPTPAPTQTPPDDPTPTPTETPEDEPSPTPTDTPPVDEPTPTPGLPSAGFTSQYEVINGEPWIVMVNGDTTVWAAHNDRQFDIASNWWSLWPGLEFYWEYGDAPGWYRVTEYFIAEPNQVDLIYSTEPDLILVTCRSYDPVANIWNERLVIYAELSE